MSERPSVPPLESADLFARGVTFFPNHFFDDLMPRLNDTQWRVLCVVGRATLGWREGANSSRRRQGWLSHSLLRRRTGRANSAVSSAVDALVRLDLIQVRDEAGNLRLTPQERRRCGGRLFYRLTDRALSGTIA